MSGSTTVLELARPAGALSARAPDRWLYASLAVAALAVVASGFAPSFYRSPGTHRPPLVLAHATLVSAWVVLFLAQATLVAAGRTALHRRLGVATAGVAALMIVSGPPLAISATRRGIFAGDNLTFLLVILADIVC